MFKKLSGGKSRPAATGPSGRSGEESRRRPVTGLDPRLAGLLHNLMDTRSRYESLRASDGSLLERAVILDHLHDLRAEIAAARRGNRP